METHLVAEAEGPREECHWVLQGKEAEQETEKSSRNAAVKILHASFGFPSGYFRANQPTDARDHEVQRPQDWKQRQEPEQTVVSQAGSSNGRTEEPEVRIDGNCGCQEVRWPEQWN